MRNTVLALVFALVLFIAPRSSSAQWNVDPAINTLVTGAFDKQIDLRMLSDGQGGAFVVWQDFRAADPDIYAQRINAAGYALWTADGVPICTAFENQSTAAIATDMAGGAIIVWSDRRFNFERDLFAQRVDSNGVALWTTDGVIVTNKPDREHNEKVVSDGAGGAIVIWEQQSQTTFEWSIWAQRINGAGQSLWQPGGIMISQPNTRARNPKGQADGRGGLFVIWQDLRNGFDYDVYAQRLDANGIPKWGTYGRAICAAADAQLNAKIDPDTTIGGAYIAWTDKRNGNNIDIYAQRVDSNGIDQWAANGVLVCGAVRNQAAVDILSAGTTHGLILTWKDQRSGNYDIYCQKVNEAGLPLWTPNGVLLTNGLYDQVNPNIVSDKHGGAIVVWQDSSNGTWNVKSQRIDSTGHVAWMPNGVLVGAAADNQVSPKNISDGAGGSIYAFQDKRIGQFDLYVHHLYGDGAPIVSVDAGVHFTGGTIFPDPFQTQFTMRLPEALEGACNFEFFDVSGQLVLKKSIWIQNGQDRNIAVQEEAAFARAGLYYMRATSEGGVWAAKFLKVQ